MEPRRLDPLRQEQRAGSRRGIKDFAKYPELRWLNKHDWVAPWALGIASLPHRRLVGSGRRLPLVTVLLWHGTFTVNSLAHVMGRRRYATTDTSRNSALIAFWTLGEGWHNNHHYYQASARQGFFWWEFDVSYYVLKGLSYVGLVKDLRVPPARVMAAARVRDGSFDMGMFRKPLGQGPRRARPPRAPATTRRRSRTHRAAARGADVASSLALRRGTGQARTAASSGAAHAWAPATERPAPERQRRCQRRRSDAGEPIVYSRPALSLSRASSSVTSRAKLSSDTRMPRARSSMDFSAVERPLPFSRRARFRTTSATW